MDVSIQSGRIFKLSIVIAVLLFGACISEPDRAGPGTTQQSDTNNEIDTDTGNPGSLDANTNAGLDAESDVENSPGDVSDQGDDISGDDISDDDATSDTGGGSEDVDSGTDDTGSPSEDTGPTDPPEPGECGGDYWDDHHDGSNPWDPFEIDCEDLAASWDCQATEDEELILALINEARQEEQECGSTTYGPSAPMEILPQLQCAARIHSWDMDGRNYYDHETPDGVSHIMRVGMVPGPLSGAYENIYDWNTTPQQIFQGWMNSPAHCRNMMCSSNIHVGIGIAGSKHTLKANGPGMCW